ncbi:MAG: glycosyltransferase family 39 protein [Chloroflexi bacterium]|nr:glycosyltransferase family 39 protein [Chloroflexota bacterium]
MRKVNHWLTPKKALIGIILISVILRVMTALYLGNELLFMPGIADQESYHNLALRVLGGHGFSFGEMWWPATRPNEPTAHWSFLYTLYLTLIYAVFGPYPVVARLIQATAVGILAPLFVYRLAVLLFSPKCVVASFETDFSKGKWIGLTAAGITAVYTYFIYYAAALMTEGFYIVAILWSFLIAIQISRNPQKKNQWQIWFLLGIVFGITVLLRQLFLLFIPFILLWLWYAVRPRLTWLILPVIIVVALILPWTIRNYIVFDHFVMLNTNSGYAFFWGNHPIYGTKFIPILPDEMGSYYSLLPVNLLHLNEAKLDSALLNLSLAEIVSDPQRYILLSVSRISPYFEFWPTASSNWLSNLSRMASFGLFLPFMLIGLIRTLFYRFPSFKERLASPFTLVYLFVVVYSAIHILTWTLIRYRLPLDAFLTIFAGLALVKLGEWLTTKRQQKKALQVKNAQST